MGSKTEEKLTHIFEQAQHEALTLLFDLEKKAATLQLTVMKEEAANQEVEDMRTQLQCIAVKEYVSVREASILLNCSDGHLRNLVEKARKGKTQNPIPYCDLDGVTTFSRVDLLAWAVTPKKRLRAVS